MGLFDKIRTMVNGNEAEDVYEDDMGATYDESTVPARNVNRGMSLNASSIELKVVRPDTFVNSRQIADHLLNNRTVVLNLEATNKETARRILDFLSGVAYSIGGQLKRVANNTFVITPDNVAVSGDQMRASSSAANSATTEEAPAAQPAQFSGDTLY
ncbi:MAG: cell division protein SepF [Eubacteriales bacterium]|nr:cell division protein SepF [Eubacterium sp.]MDD7573170.1 cell division protein SepF [Eubacteriales bacterium]MDY5355033.1 cell division protein SepF [Eubacteriales bacterium]